MPRIHWKSDRMNILVKYYLWFDTSELHCIVCEARIKWNREVVPPNIKIEANNDLFTMQRIFYFKYFLIYVLCFRSFDDARQLHSDEVNQLNWKKWSRNSSSFHYLFGHKFMCLNKNSIKKTHSAGEWVNPNVYIFQSLTVSALFRILL